MTLGPGFNGKKLFTSVIITNACNKLLKGVTYGRKKFNNIGPWTQSYKTFYVRNLQIFVISFEC
jgi:hypothetical protein